MGVWWSDVAVDQARRWRLLALVSLLAAFASSCSFDGTAQPPLEEADVGDAADVSDVLGDAADAADATDSADADAGGSDYQQPCDSDDDCDSGHCYPGPNGDVCTVECTGDAVCGEGWVCEALKDDLSTSLCFPEATLCTDTCTTDDDCRGRKNVCVEHPDGNFCSRPCDLRGCPDGYDCSSIESVDDRSFNQCMPNSTVCADCFDEDGDGYGIGETCTDTDCDDANDAAYPGAEELCDTVDNNCDGEVDEGCDCASGDTQSCYSGASGTEGVGKCQVGSQSCTDGAWGSCDGEVTPDGDETCDDGVDNDCDGSVDEACQCDFNGSAEGVCASGELDASGTCIAPGTFEATEASCDGVDNDCDGVGDEGCQCDFGGTSEGVCAAGTIGDAGSCQQPVGYEADESSCDGVDNDCDAQTDEDCGCNYNGTSEGVCTTATIGSSGNCQQPVGYEATETSCDGVDNDCDGVADAGCACDYNGTSEGVCSGGTIDGSGACQPPGDYNGTELCDGVDNNCDGQTDEGCSCINGETQSCYNGAAGTAGVGECAQGTQTCAAGSWGACAGEVTPTSEACDSADNDCDGLTDEDCQCDYGGTSAGVCSNGANDGSGGCNPPADYQATESSCDGLDNDCDGTVDEGCCSGVDTTSAVSATSGCLTTGTSAESAIVVELVDANGDPLGGANVTMTTTAGTLSAVNSNGNTYWATLSPPASSGISSATVTVSVDDSCSGQTVQMATQVNVAFAAPMAGADGGAGGCAADGNVRVRVVEAEDGSAIANANVMIGNAEDSSAYVTSYDVPADGANTGVTDANGYVEFKDLAAALDSPIAVTAGATGRAYMTMVDVDASDLVLPLEQVNPANYSQIYDGDLTSIDAGDEIDAGFMLSDVTIDQVMDFNLNTLLSDNVCYQSGHWIVGNMNLPGNVFMPQQNFWGSLDKKPYNSAPIDYGERLLTGISGETSQSDATSGDIIQILQGLDFQKMGVRTETVSANSSTSGVDIDMTNTLSDNVDCNISNAPADSDVFCLMTGDWDSKNDANIPLGAGRLFLMGLRLGDAAQHSGAFTINNVSTVASTGVFTDIQYMGASVAAYIDSSKTPPAGAENGASIIARRDPSLVDANGATLSFDDYIPIRPLTVSGRQLSASTLGSGSFPSPHYTRTTVRQKVTETYSACGANDSERTFYNTLWTVYTDGATDAYTLPTLPSGWPRAAHGGFVDVASTPDNDVINWLHMSLHEGLNSGFNYDTMRFSSLRSAVTHASINNVDQ